ncbi:MAG TPA: thioredoxin-disulfide reductase [Gammaproteobacteria bacterium]|jgi:thioredoxin reductase (NADPH)|nr:thioredoxin-disulfide reductase [Gammaproteobacteria bacterium]HIK77570.1 thioredoxin-disulfide reductase [Gammaproteobacteria bacterium]
MTTTEHRKLIILGAGPAGYSAAVYAARANLKPTLITGSEPGGQLMTTIDVENWPGDPEGLIGPALMDRMMKHAERFETEIIYDHIEKSDFSSRPYKLFSGNKIYTADAIIISTGSTAKYLGLESEEIYKGKGVSACATCDGFFYKDQDVVVVGGGNVAAEEAIYLSNIAKKVTLIHRRDKLRAEKMLQDKLFEKTKGNGNIDILWNHTLKEVVGDESGVNSILLNDLNNDGEDVSLPIQGVFIAIGHNPNTEIFDNQIQLDHSNYIVLDKSNNRFSTQTSVEGIFAAGDVADPIYRQAVTSAGSGCMAALDAEKYLDNLD